MSNTSNDDTAAGTSTDVEFKWVNIPAGTTIAEPMISPPLEWDQYRFKKPHPKNTRVEKKVKMAGWSKQFYEK